MHMFKGCTSLTVAPELPATTLVLYCYEEMFMGCTSLAVAPELPATTLASYCYEKMFNGCTSLTVAPELPATTPAAQCYAEMFNGCTSLNTVTTMQTGWGNYTTSEWLSNVAATGTFYCPAALGTNETITRGTSACPEGWTVINI